MPSARKVLSLSAGNNQLSAMLVAAGATITMGLTELTYKVESGGPVAVGDSSMAALADGSQLALGDSNTERATDRTLIDATQVYFRPTTPGDKISVIATTR